MHQTHRHQTTRPQAYTGLESLGVAVDGRYKNELDIMAAALPLVEAVPPSQDSCWPGDGPAHDDDCVQVDHAASAAAVAATEGLSWDFSTWSATADWFRRALVTVSTEVR